MFPPFSPAMIPNAPKLDGFIEKLREIFNYKFVKSAYIRMINEMHKDVYNADVPKYIQGMGPIVVLACYWFDTHKEVKNETVSESTAGECTTCSEASCMDKRDIPTSS